MYNRGRIITGQAAIAAKQMGEASMLLEKLYVQALTGIQAEARREGVTLNEESVTVRVVIEGRTE
jgi:hypothetical protein